MILAPNSLPARLGLLAAALLALAACQREAAPAPQESASAAPPVNPAPIDDQPAESVPPATAPVSSPPPAAAGLARFDGYGDLRFGMTAEQAKQAWGGELKGKPDEPGGCYYLQPIWGSNPREFGFMVEDGKFVRVDVGNDKEIAPGGGKKGMSADEIGKLYAGRVETQPHKYEQGAKYLRIKDASGASSVLVFETDSSGRVTSWRIGLQPQVDYLEGCG